jgi:hypothetical protein
MSSMNLLRSIAIRAILELKTRPEQLLGYRPLVIVLPDLASYSKAYIPKNSFFESFKLLKPFFHRKMKIYSLD